MTESPYARSAFGVEVRSTLIYERTLELAHKLCWNSEDLGLTRVRVPGHRDKYVFDWVDSIKELSGIDRHTHLRDEYWCKREQVINILLDTAMQAYRADSQNLLSSLTGGDFQNADLIKFGIKNQARQYTGAPDSTFIDLNSRSIALVEIKIGNSATKYSIDQNVKYETMAALLRTEAFFPGFQVLKVLLAPMREFSKNVSQPHLLGASSNSAGCITFSHDSDALAGLTPKGNADILSLVGARLTKLTKGATKMSARDYFDGEGVLFFPWREVEQRCSRGLLRDNLRALFRYLAPEEVLSPLAGQV
jgi:hypothetical protein